MKQEAKMQTKEFYTENIDYILPLADELATLDRVGGKGASLARLAAGGLPVPDGFHITTVAYKQFVVANQLQPAIMTALAEADPNRPSTLENAADQIRILFTSASLPKECAEAIIRAYKALPGSRPAVAVRSSATAEDLPEASFAGQHETFLNIQGESDLLAAVQRCWSSLWTARAIGYRLRNRIDQEIVSLAVVVQLLIPADAAGILFTANPVNGRRHEAVISAAWGLGEAIVGGLVTPDSITLDKKTEQVTARETADKQIMTVRTADGTSEEPTPAEIRHAPVLSDKQAAKLVRLGAQIEQEYRMPMDIEWTLCKGSFAIVQARPITALPEPVTASLEHWPLPQPDGQYLRGSAAELLPDPMCPLFESIGAPALDRGTRELFAYISGQAAEDVQQVIYTINGYAYMTTTFSRKQWFLMTTRGLIYIYRLIKNGEANWRQHHQKYTAALARQQTLPVADRTAVDLLAGVRELTQLGMETYNWLQSGIIPASTTSETVFTNLYEKLLRREGDPPALTFLLGFNSLPIRAEKSLYAISAWIKDQPALKSLLQQTTAAELASLLTRTEPPAGIANAVWQIFRARFDSHLELFGHTIYDLDFAKPTPADDPTPLLHTLLVYVTAAGRDPQARQEKLAAQREAGMQALRRRYRRGLRRWLFEKTAGWAQKATPLREEGLADIGLGWPLLRQMLQEIGRRTAAAGLIAQADDIFWLQADEVETAVSALDRGEQLESAQTAVVERKAIWQARKRAIPPSILPPKGKFLGIDIEKWMPARVDQVEGKQISGVGASPGEITGPACVLHGPEDFSRMQPGDILVAAITTPAWTPLFALASAVVTDIGGPLSHSSIVAREYGIPAVLGTGVATKRIQSGQTITVDGTTGKVILAA
jgi:phosphohistidine swiveling domain-containing protein